MNKMLRVVWKEAKKKQLVRHMTLSGVASMILTGALFIVEEMRNQKKKASN